MKKIIPVVFSTIDDDYIYYLYVSIFSILKHSRKKEFYNFYILVPDDFSESSKRKINVLSNLYSNSQFSFINMGDAFKETQQIHAHVKYPTYYRLLIPNILAQYDKCIYLDSDTLICSDLSRLYEHDVSDVYVAGVKAAAYMLNEHNIKDNTTRLHIADVSNYINAGVLLLNLKKIREDNLVTKFLGLMQHNFRDQDQDIINVACYKKIKTLPYKYNMMTKYEKIYNQCMDAKAYTSSEIAEAISNPIIIHYADKIKPWQNNNVFQGKKWWTYAKQTPFYQNILLANEKTLLKGISIEKDKEVSNQGILNLRKNITYYRYKILSKIMIGKKRDKYEKKYKDLKQKIRAIRNFNKGI